MTQYEQILGKISPTFYKLIQYELYFFSNYDLIFSYLYRFKIPRHKYIHIPLNNLDQKNYSMKSIENTKYPYYVTLHSFIINGKELDIRTIIMEKKYRFYSSYFTTYSEFIVSLIINKFSFENERISNIPITTFKDLFVGLVGRDMYDTIRANIK